jgi:hypothetical protein
VLCARAAWWHCLAVPLPLITRQMTPVIYVIAGTEQPPGLLLRGALLKVIVSPEHSSIYNVPIGRPACHAAASLFNVSPSCWPAAPQPILTTSGL